MDYVCMVTPNNSFVKKGGRMPLCYIFFVILSAMISQAFLPAQEKAGEQEFLATAEGKFWGITVVGNNASMFLIVDEKFNPKRFISTEREDNACFDSKLNGFNVSIEVELKPLSMVWKKTNFGPSLLLKRGSKIAEFNSLLIGIQESKTEGGSYSAAFSDKFIVHKLLNMDADLIFKLPAAFFDLSRRSKSDENL